MAKSVDLLGQALRVSLQTKIILDMNITESSF